MNDFKFYTELSTGKKTFKDLPKETYFLGGYQDEKDKGLASIAVNDNGTVLTPLFAANGERVRTTNPKLFGKELQEVFITDKAIFTGKQNFEFINQL